MNPAINLLAPLVASHTCTASNCGSKMQRLKRVSGEDNLSCWLK